MASGQSILRATWRDGKAFWKEMQADDLQGRAAQVAYHLLFSIIPLLIFLTALSGFVSRQVGVGDTMGTITDWLNERLSPDQASAILTPINQVVNSSAGGLLSFGAVTALWGGRNAIGAIISALNGVFTVEESRPWWRQQAIALGLTLVVGVSIIAGSVALVLSAQVGGNVAEQIGLGAVWGGAWRWVQPPLILVVITLVLMLLYWLGPNHPLPFRAMWPGAVAAVVGWLVAVFALSIYFSRFAGYLGTAYGALGGVMAFVFFLYVMSLIVLLGGELNAMLADGSLRVRTPSSAQRQTRPGEGPSASRHHGATS